MVLIHLPHSKPAGREPAGRLVVRSRRSGRRWAQSAGRAAMPGSTGLAAEMAAHVDDEGHRHAQQQTEAAHSRFRGHS
jgi:hypothetical protein